MTHKDDSTFVRMFALGKLIRSRAELGGSLPLGQLETLRFVVEAKSPTMQEVAEYHRITAPSATALIAELVAPGYLTREHDQSDRRIVRLAPTALGKKILRTNMERRRKIIDELLAGLSPNERAQFNTLLDKILITKK